MSFESLLQVILDECGGALGVALMGNDGIPIAELQVDRAGVPDVSTAGVEFGRILGELRKAADAVSAGALQETIVEMERFHLILRAVDDETMLVLALAPDGNLGKARYLIRRQLLPLREEL